MTNELTPDTARAYLQGLFAKAGRPDGRYRTEEEQLEYLSENGAQNFKRRALGFCGRTSIKSLDEVTRILVDTGLVSTIAEARQTVPKIVQANKLHTHAINRGGLRYMGFDEVKDQTGDTKYRITAWVAD